MMLFGSAEPVHVGTRLTDMERSIFDGSSLGVVERDMANRVHYANKAAMDMMGVDSFEGLNLAASFADEAAKKILEEQTEERRKGLLGNYRVVLSRLDDPERKVEVEITGVPLFNADGEVVHALGFYRNLHRQRLVEEIRRLTFSYGTASALSQGDRKAMLHRVAENVRSALPYDLMIVSRLNDRDGESAIYFAHPAFEQKIPTVWLKLSSAQMDFMHARECDVNDFEQALKEPPWRDIADHPMVQQMRALELKSSMWRWVRRPEHSDDDHQPLVTISLLSSRADAYDGDAQALFRQLPIDEAVLQVLEDEQRSRALRKLQLFKALNRCTDVGQACERLAGALVEMFEDWSHVSLFRVEKGLDRIRMVASMRQVADGCSSDAERYWQGYTQPTSVGILGRVIESRAPRAVGDVSLDRDYIQGPLPHPVRSELVVPIIFEGESRVRFLINVDDPRQDAFSHQDEVQLMEVAQEVAGAMQRISQLTFLSECFDNATEPIIATDAKLEIRKANPAAAALLGVNHPLELNDHKITEYFVESGPFHALALDTTSNLRSEELGELAIKRRRTDAAPATAFVTRKDFPDTLGGHVFIARDLSGIRNKVQLEFLENEAYEIAVETQAPLNFATSFLEGWLDAATAPDPQEVQKVIRQLARVKHAFARLAMYNPGARVPSATAVNLMGELHALVATLPGATRAKVDLPEDTDPSIEIEADHTQVLIVIETLLSALLRAAPGDARVAVRLDQDPRAVFLSLRGRLPMPTQTSERSGLRETAQTELRRADPLLNKLMHEQGGTLSVDALPNGDTQFALYFPKREVSP